MGFMQYHCGSMLFLWKLIWMSLQCSIPQGGMPSGADSHSPTQGLDVPKNHDSPLKELQTMSWSHLVCLLAMTIFLLIIVLVVVLLILWQILLRHASSPRILLRHPTEPDLRLLDQEDPYTDNQAVCQGGSSDKTGEETVDSPKYVVDKLMDMEHMYEPGNNKVRAKHLVSYLLLSDQGSSSDDVVAQLPTQRRQFPQAVTQLIDVFGLKDLAGSLVDEPLAGPVDTFQTRYDAIIEEFAKREIRPPILMSEQPADSTDALMSFAFKLIEYLDNLEASQDPFNMWYLDCVWALFILLGSLAILQWLPGMGRETDSGTRQAGSYIFVAYAAGSIASAFLACCCPVFFAQQSYAFCNLADEEVSSSSDSKKPVRTDTTHTLIFSGLKSCCSIWCGLAICVVVIHQVFPGTGGTHVKDFITTTQAHHFRYRTTMTPPTAIWQQSATTSATTSTTGTIALPDAPWCLWLPRGDMRHGCSKALRKKLRWLDMSSYSFGEAISELGVLAVVVTMRWLCTFLLENALYPIRDAVKDIVDNDVGKLHETIDAASLVFKAVYCCDLLAFSLRLFIMHAVPNIISGIMAFAPVNVNYSHCHDGSCRINAYFSNLVDVRRMPWTFCFRILLLLDTLTYTMVLVMAFNNKRARNILFPWGRLTFTRVLKAMLTPIELLIVLNGFFGTAFAYSEQQHRRAAQTRRAPVISIVAVIISSSLLSWVVVGKPFGANPVADSDSEKPDSDSEKPFKAGSTSIGYCHDQKGDNSYCKMNHNSCWNNRRKYYNPYFLTDPINGTLDEAMIQCNKWSGCLGFQFYIQSSEYALVTRFIYNEFKKTNFLSLDCYRRRCSSFTSRAQCGSVFMCHYVDSACKFRWNRKKYPR